MTGTQTRPAWPIPLEDPYPALARMREDGPVHRLEDLDSLLVVCHPVAQATLTAPAWSSDPTTSPQIVERMGGGAIVGATMAKTMLFSDPPEHARLRKAGGRHLTPRAVEALRPRIAAIVDAAFSVHKPGEDLEVMDEIAYPVPLAVICELLDVPVEIAEALRRDTPTVAAMLDPLADAAALEEAAGAAFGLMLELVPVVADRRTTPGADLLSAFVADDETGPGLAADEAIVMALLLLAAGHETTANLIGNAVVAIHDHPDVARALRANPDLIPSAVEELLRYDSPVQLTGRVAKADVDLAGTSVAAGQQVLVSLGAANRDPEAFPQPDLLDFQRQTRGHLAFGHGAHFCAGASLARAEAQEVLRRLVLLEPALEELEIRVRRGQSATFRRIDSLTLSEN